MFLRQTGVGLLRRFCYRSQTATANSCGRATSALANAGKLKFYHQHSSGDYTSRGQHGDFCLWIFLSGQAALILGINANHALAEDVSIKSAPESDTRGANITGLRKIEDGSVISNLHTSKWRVFTDAGRDLFLKGKLEDAEKLFLSALQEAKEGFGERDPHVASACNNLAELYRVRKDFDKAEPLYLEAIKILEESFGPDDIRVGAALHNLGQLYLVQRKLEEAHVCYERALKIKRRVLGPEHTDTADTMYHLGTVLYLQGKEKDSLALIQDSIRILEEGGQGESNTCIRRLQYLAQIYIKSNQLAEAENVLRKILHILELSKGWNSLVTVTAAEGLALTLQSVGRLKEAQELLERCLDAWKTLLPKDHIQIAANMLLLARVKMLNFNQLRKKNISEAIAELDMAKNILDSSIRIARQVLEKSMKQKVSHQYYEVSRESGKDARAALVILLKSLNALGLLETTKQELQESREEHPCGVDTENALHQCISAFKECYKRFSHGEKVVRLYANDRHYDLLYMWDPRGSHSDIQITMEFGSERSVSNSPEVRAEYLSCLKHLVNLIMNSRTYNMQQSRSASLQELKDEIKRVEAEHSLNRKHRV